MLAAGWIIFIIIFILVFLGLFFGLYFGLQSDPKQIPTPTPTPTVTPTPSPSGRPTPTLTPLPPGPQNWLYVACQDTIQAFSMATSTPVFVSSTGLTGGLVNDQGIMGLSGDSKTMWIMTTTGLVALDLTLDPLPGTLSTLTVPIPNTLYGMAVYNTRAYVINNLGANSDFITVDLTTSTILSTLPLPINSTPRSLAVSPFGDKAYVCTITSGVTTIRPILNLSTTPTLGLNTATGSIVAGLNCVVSTDGNTLYVSDFDPTNGGVYPVDVSGATPIIGSRIVTANLSQGIAISQSNTVAVVGGTGPTSVLNTITNNVAGSQINTNVLGGTLLTIYTATNTAYITNKTGSSNLSAVDLTGQLALAPIASGGTNPSGIAFGPIPGTV